MGDWTPLACVAPDIAADVNMCGSSDGRWPAGGCGGGIVYHHKFEKKVTAGTGKIIGCSLVNQKADGTYDNYVWSGFYTDCLTQLKIALAAIPNKVFSGAAWGSFVKGHWSKFCPNLATQYYDDLDTNRNLFLIGETVQCSGNVVSDWNDNSKLNYTGQSVENKRTKNTAEYVNVISWNKDETVIVGVDDYRYVFDPTTLALGITKENWVKSGTITPYRYGCQGSSSGGSERNFSNPNDWKYDTGYMPIFGCLGEKSVNDILVTNYTAKGEKITVDKIKLIEGIPVFEGKKGDKVEWEIQMDDTNDYLFYFSYDKFDGVPDTSKCIKCTTDKEKTETETPKIEGGKTTIKFTFSQDGVVWAKWKHESSLGNAVLNLQACKTYKLTEV